MIHDTRDLSHIYKGGATTILDVTADFCPACGESITDMGETERVMREMQAFNKQVNEITKETLAKSERGEDVHHAKDAKHLFDQLGI